MLKLCGDLNLIVIDISGILLYSMKFTLT